MGQGGGSWHPGSRSARPDALRACFLLLWPSSSILGLVSTGDRFSHSSTRARAPPDRRVSSWMFKWIWGALTRRPEERGMLKLREEASGGGIVQMLGLWDCAG